MCSLLTVIQVCVWQCESNELVNSTNTTTVCIAPSNTTLARAALVLLELFGWNRTITVIDSSKQEESHAVGLVEFTNEICSLCPNRYLLVLLELLLST